MPSRPRLLRPTFAITVVFLLLLTSPWSANAQTYQILHEFAGPTSDGATPFGFVLGGNGTIYGTTCYGGTGYNGTAYELSATGNETILYNFNAGYGSCPTSLFPWKGNLYGSAAGGAYGGGLLFKLNLSGKETVLHTFGKNLAEGVNAYLLYQTPSGLFYGATGYDGLYGYGTLFTADTFGKVTVIYNFPDNMWGQSINSFIPDGSGNFYGATYYGGSANCAYGCGTIFKFDAAGNWTTLYSFTGGADGAYPNGVIRDGQGNLYGTTAEGGSKCVLVSCGTVFKFSSTGQLTTLHSFTGGADGILPSGTIVRDKAGNLYGTTSEGGDMSCADFINYGGCGTLFKLDPSGNETIVHTFTGPPGDAGTFGAILLKNAAGDIYGASY